MWKYRKMHCIELGEFLKGRRAFHGTGWICIQCENIQCFNFHLTCCYQSFTSAILCYLRVRTKSVTAILLYLYIYMYLTIYRRYDPKSVRIHRCSVVVKYWWIISPESGLGFLLYLETRKLEICPDWLNCGSAYEIVSGFPSRRSTGSPIRRHALLLSNVTGR